MMKTFPVTVNYGKDTDSQIGTITLDMDRVPQGAAYCFAIGGICRDAGMEWDTALQRKIYTIRELELTEVSLISEKEYYDYLKHEEEENLKYGKDNEEELNHD
jgi:hypothetical protein